jgi:hypothetical protein
VIRRLAGLAFWGGAAATQLAPLLAAVVVAAGAREVVYVAPHARDAVAMNRDLWERGQPVAEIYGVPIKRLHILWPDPSKIVVPAEDPSLTLLLVEKSAGENPLQSTTVWFFAGRASLAGAFAALAGAGLLLLGSRR